MKRHAPIFYPYREHALLSYKAASFGASPSKFWEIMLRMLFSMDLRDDVLKFGSKICYNGNEFWDDGLNEAEMDLICGVYKLYSKRRTPIVDIL